MKRLACLNRLILTAYCVCNSEPSLYLYEQHSHKLPVIPRCGDGDVSYTIVVGRVTYVSEYGHNKWKNIAFKSRTTQLFLSQ